MSTAATAPVKNEIVLKINPMQVRPFAHQPREYFNSDELIALELSILQHGQIQAGIVREIEDDPDHQYEIVDGQRRWHACMKLRLPFRAQIVKPESLEAQFEMSVAANFQRAEHTPMEISRAIDRICGQNEKSEAYVATLMGKSPFWINIYRRLVHLAPELQELVEPITPDAERIPISVATQLARLPHNEQRSIFETMQKKGLNRSAILDRIKTELSDAGVTSPRTMFPTNHLRNVQVFLKSSSQKVETILERLPPEISAGVAALLREKRRSESVQSSIRELIEHLQDLAGRLVASAPAPKEKQIESSVIEPEPSTSSVYVFSKPVTCPTCRASQTRFRKERDADPATGHWVCMARGCMKRISHIVLKIDRNYHGE